MGFYDAPGGIRKSAGREKKEQKKGEIGALITRRARRTRVSNVVQRQRCFSYTRGRQPRMEAASRQVRVSDVRSGSNSLFLLHFRRPLPQKKTNI